MHGYNNYNLKHLNELKSKEELIKEVKRLSNTVKGRIHTIKNAKIKNKTIDKFIAEQGNIRGKNYKNNYTTVSKSFTESQLRQLIFSYNQFLRSATSSKKGIIERSEKLREMIGDDISTNDLVTLDSEYENYKETLSHYMESFDSGQIVEQIKIQINDKMSDDEKNNIWQRNIYKFGKYLKNNTDWAQLKIEDFYEIAGNDLDFFE